MSARGGRAPKRGRPRASVRAPLSPARLEELAAELADAHGLGAVTLARLATEAGVKTPSLYAHLDGLPALLSRLKLRGLRGLGAEMQRACVGRAGADALVALCDAQRTYARAHPGLFSATIRLDPHDGPEVRAAAEQVLDVVLAVLRGYGLAGDDALHATRALRAATRGFIELELAGGFGMPIEVDESWRRLVALIDQGLRARAP